MLKGGHSDSDSESETNIKVNSHMGPVAEKTVSVNLEGSCNEVISIWSIECSMLSSIHGRAKTSCVNILQLQFQKWPPGGSVCRAVSPGGHFQNFSCKC